MKAQKKKLRVTERKLRSKPKKPRRRGKSHKRLEYVVISEMPRVLRLRNGTRLKQGGKDIDLYLSEGGKVYSLTRYGLRQMHINYHLKNNYCKKVNGKGHNQGQLYPYVRHKSKTYFIHTMMAYAWLGRRRKNKQIDHINGNIKDCRKRNLRYLTKKKNNWCGGILRRLRNASAKYNLPMMNPARREPEDMLEVFKRFKGRDVKEALAEEIERQKVIHRLMQAAQELHDPSIDPRNMTPERRELILSKYRVVDAFDQMEWEMTHHMEC